MLDDKDEFYGHGLRGRILHGEDGTVFAVTDVRCGEHNSIVYIIVDQNGSRAEVEDHNIAVDDKGRTIICGEIFYK